jgi:GMP synthase (glutamine-hydrolysing)
MLARPVLRLGCRFPQRQRKIANMTATSQPSPSTADTSGIGVDLSNEDQILVLDFGGQTAQLITRRVREENVFCQLVRHNLSVERIREIAPKGIILSGGPDSVYGDGAP